MKTITVGMVPGTLSQVAVEDNATVADVLSAADLSAEGLEIRVNGSVATVGSSVSDGSKVYLVKKVKGNMKTVTVGMVPGTLSQVAVEDNATVSDVLGAADLSAEGLEIRVNGSVATLQSSVSDGAKVYLVKKVKGNMKTVTVGMVPGTLSQVAVEDNATVADVLDAADLSAEGLEIRVNGSVATLQSSVSDGSKVYLVKKVKGN